MIDLNDLNPMQREAAEYTEGPLLILAGAGSGKTRALTYRIAHLIEKGVAPFHILAITFTNKAASEMQDRVEKLAGESGKEAWVSTFHSLCARILRRDIEKLGYKREFVIYDEDDKLSVIKAIIKEKGLRDDVYQPKTIKYTISDAKNHLQLPENWFNESDKTAYNRTIADIYRDYETKLRAGNALDFDDLILKTLILFSENPPVLDYYRSRFQYILVDEYQDTNMAQYELVRVLASGSRNLCVVGDDDQSIYGWRGADIRNILEFEKDFPDTKVIKLEQNYRSTGVILDAANHVISHNRGRKEKKLWTDKSGGDAIELYSALDERDEALYVARKIASLKEQNENDSIAVLYRTNAQSRALEEAFVRAGIRYTVYGGLRFYERKEVKDVLAYMRILVDPDDDVSVRRIINEPKRSIGDSTVEALTSYASINGISLMSAAFEAENAGLSKRALTAVNSFTALMLDLTEKLATSSLSDFMEALLDKTGIVHSLQAQKSEENQSRIENIKELQGAVAEFEKKSPEGSTLIDFLESVSLVSDMDQETSRGYVAMMTVHSAKGLEFDTVFLVGMEENIFPISRAVFEQDDMEEERRLCYVAITRAKKKLFISHARNRMLYNVRRADPLSRFINDEIPRTLMRNGNIRQGFSRGSLPSVNESRDGSAQSHGPSASSPRANASSPARPDQKFVPSVARTQETTASLFAVGDTVYHRTFGRGKVLRITGEGKDQKLAIDFNERGQKILAAAFAPIVRIKG